MTPYQLEELENMRRTAERGKMWSEDLYNDGMGDEDAGDLIDLFVHILDTVKRIKNAT